MTKRAKRKTREISAEDYLDRVYAIMTSEAIKKSKKKVNYVV